MWRLILLLCLPCFALAKVPQQARSSLLSLVGQWQGQMEFVDPNNGQLINQPLQLTINSNNDQTALLVHREFMAPDLPVDTFTIRTLTQPAQVAYVRQGRMKTFQSRTTIMQQLNDASWILVQEHHDVEGDRPVTVRHTLRRSGDKLSNTKEIDFRDDKEALWQLRYRSDYQRIDGVIVEQPEPFMLAPQRRGHSQPVLPIW